MALELRPGGLLVSMMLDGPPFIGVIEEPQTTIGLPPLNATLARRMLERSKFYQALLHEFRGARLPALEDALVRFSQLVTEQPGIRDFEIDPLLLS